MWTLDREFFRFLVGLYMLTLFLAAAASIYETLGPSWSAFSDDFAVLVDQHFGPMSETQMAITLAVFVVGFIWHLAAAFGLRAFRRWARWNFWLSEILMLVAIFLSGNGSVLVLGPLGNLTERARLGLFGIVILLAYARDQGAEWFKPPLTMLKETF